MTVSAANLVSLVEKSESLIDQMDAGMDMLNTAMLALFANDFVDEDTLPAIRGTIEQALKRLGPVRTAINEMHAAA